MSQIIPAEGAAIAPTHDTVARALNALAEAVQALTTTIPRLQAKCPHVQVLHVPGQRAPVPKLPVRLCPACRLLEVGSAFADERTWRLFGGRPAQLANTSFRQIVIADLPLVESLVLPVGVQPGEVENLC